jgi:hypothetical protein
MKAFFTPMLVLLIAVSALGQQRKPETRVETITMKILPVSGLLKKKVPETVPVVRLYRRPHARVKKALSFTTPEHRPKFA